jgi:hypothetical protein
MTGPVLIPYPHVSLAAVADHLRKVADKIDKGDFGAVGCCSVVVLGNKLNVFGFGSDAAGPSCAAVLMAGAHQLIETIVHHGESNG